MSRLLFGLAFFLCSYGIAHDVSAQAGRWQCSVSLPQNLEVGALYSIGAFGEREAHEQNLSSFLAPLQNARVEQLPSAQMSIHQLAGELGVEESLDAQSPDWRLQEERRAIEVAPPSGEVVSGSLENLEAGLAQLNGFEFDPERRYFVVVAMARADRLTLNFDQDAFGIDWRAIAEQAGLTVRERGDFGLERTFAETRPVCVSALEVAQSLFDMGVGGEVRSTEAVSGSYLGAEELSLPRFPWPYPEPSTQARLSPDIFAGASTLGGVDARLVAALSEAGYIPGVTRIERSYYWAPNGFVLVARLERIRDDARPHQSRFLAPNSQEPFNLLSAVRGLFFAQPGYYRQIAFVVTDHGIQTRGQNLTAGHAERLLRTGAPSLPEALRNVALTGQHSVNALIYEFQRDSEEQTASVRKPARHEASIHLERSGLFTRSHVD